MSDIEKYVEDLERIGEKTERAEQLKKEAIADVGQKIRASRPLTRLAWFLLAVVVFAFKCLPITLALVTLRDRPDVAMASLLTLLAWRVLKFVKRWVGMLSKPEPRD